MKTQEHADREWELRERCNTARRVEVTDSGVPPPQILADPKLATAWVLDRSKTMTGTSKRRLRRLN